MFGEEEVLRRPPDPFEEKILTGRNSFTDLRDHLAEEDTDRPRSGSSGSSRVPRTPATRSRVGAAGDSKVAALRRDLAGGGGSSRSSAADSRSRFLQEDDVVETRPRSRVSSDSEERLASLRRELADRRAATADPAPRVRPSAPSARRPRVSREEEVEIRERATQELPPRSRRPVVDDPPPRRVPRTRPPVEEYDYEEPFENFEPEVETPPPPPRQRRTTTRKPVEVVEVIEEIEEEDLGPSFEPPQVIEEEPPVIAILEEAPVEPPVEKKETRRRAKTPKAEPAPVVTPSRAPRAATGEIAKISGLTKIIGSSSQKTEVLRRVDLVLGQGQMTAIMGSPGAGVSTLIQCIAGIESPTSGSITVAGQNITGFKEGQLAKFRRSNVSHVFSAFNLIPTLTTAENIRLPMILQKKSVDSAWYDQVVTTLHLTDALTHKPSALSPSQRQRVAFARALLGKPAIIVADDPTADLNQEASVELIGWVRDCMSISEQSIVVGTQDPILAAMADRVCVMRDGVIVTEISSPSVSRVMDALRTVAGG